MWSEETVIGEIGVGSKKTHENDVFFNFHLDSRTEMILIFTAS